MPGSKSSVRANAAVDEPVGLTVHSLPQPGLLRSRAAQGRWRMLLILLVCAAPVIASYLAYFVIQPAGTGAAYGELINPAVPMPEVAVVDSEGQPRQLTALKGQWLLVVADGGKCAGRCERHLFVQRQLREMLGRERDRLDKVWLVLDDAAVSPALRQALASTPAMHVVRVPSVVLAAWLKPAAGQALTDHLYVVDPMGRWMMRMPVDADPARVKRDLERLLRASASWDAHSNWQSQ